MGVLSIGGKVKFEGSKFILMDSLVQFNSSIGGKFKFKGAELTPMESLVWLLQTHFIVGNTKFEVAELTLMESSVQFDYSKLTL